jgi:hypothetical protein
LEPEEMGLLPGNTGPVVQKSQIYPSPAQIGATFGPDVIEETPAPLLQKVQKNWMLYLAIALSFYYIFLGGNA